MHHQFARYTKILCCRLRLKCDGTRAETRIRLSAKRTTPFKSAGSLVQSTPGSRGVRISGSNAGYTMFRGSVKGTGYPLHAPVSPSLPRPCVTVWHHISNGLYPHVYYWVPQDSQRKPHLFLQTTSTERSCDAHAVPSVTNVVNIHSIFI